MKHVLARTVAVAADGAAMAVIAEAEAVAAAEAMAEAAAAAGAVEDTNSNADGRRAPANRFAGRVLFGPISKARERARLLGNIFERRNGRSGRTVFIILETLSLAGSILSFVSNRLDPDPDHIDKKRLYGCPSFRWESSL
jgi:hypothetical protein